MNKIYLIIPIAILLNFILVIYIIPIDHPIQNCDVIILINKTPFPEILGIFMALMCVRGI